MQSLIAQQDVNVFVVLGGAAGRMWSTATRSDSAEVTTPTVSVNNVTLPSRIIDKSKNSPWIELFICSH